MGVCPNETSGTEGMDQPTVTETERKREREREHYTDTGLLYKMKWLQIKSDQQAFFITDEPF